LMAKVEAMVQHRVAAMMQAKGGVNFNGANDRVPGLKASEIEKLRAEGRCFRCKQKGHSKRDCPKGPKPSFQ
jgi:ribosomal protein S6E (S10)